MSVYVQPAEIQPRVGNRPITSTSEPSLDDVQDLLNEAEADLLGTLRASGIPTSYSGGSEGFLQIRNWVREYVAGLVRQAHAATGGDGSNDDGDKQVAEWKVRLREIKADPDHYSAKLGSGSSSTSSVRLGSHTTDAALGLTASDYAPVFRIKGENF